MMYVSVGKTIHEGGRLKTPFGNFRKVCGCESKSTAGSVFAEEDEAGKMTMTCYPGPVCDECKKPWEEE